jgi:hypothetical protein
MLPPFSAAGAHRTDITMKRLAALLLVVLTFQPVSTATAQRPPGGRQSRVVVLIDSSSSMGGMLNQFRAGLKAFLDGLPEETEVALVSIGGQLRVRVQPTTDKAQLLDAAGRWSSDGGGNMLLDSLLEADRRFFLKAPDRRAIFVIVTTDADSAVREAREDQYNRFLDDFLFRRGRAHGVVVQGNSIGVNRHVVENLTGNTGGFYETILVASALPKLMATLAAYVSADL